MRPIPERIARIEALARDLWWCWTPIARRVFRQLDYSLWRQTAHNPVRMLQLVTPETLERAIANPEWLAVYDEAITRFDAARQSASLWCDQQCPNLSGTVVAYFSAEFALHQSLPIYAGGLGVLAGDHCKEASDLGVPLVGVGFMYPQGYFHQSLTADGWQQEIYETLNWSSAPVEPAATKEGKPCIVAVPLGNRTVLVSVWRVRVGRVLLYLLDTNLQENAPWDRELSARLYGGDREVRLQQEIILGMGGVRVLKAMGYTPVIYHLNEGHAAFVVLQRIHDLCATGKSFEAALTDVRRTTVFTTHTPVAAGHDAFPFHMVESHLAGAWGDLGGHREQFLALGHYDTGGGPMFNMTALALRTSGATNGVSRLHREVTSQMWATIWPGTSRADIPIRSITNGVHVGTWMSAEMWNVLTRHLGPDWVAHHDDPAVVDRIMEIPDAELWAARQALRDFLFGFLRERARARWTLEHVSAARIVAAATLFDHATLTIGFARRFTSYKRPELIFADPDRLAHLLVRSKHPVQLVFAGKAHPADEAGKHHLQQIYRRAIDPKFGGRIGFIDDYDLHVAHFLTQGCDVWLNTPRKPMEASGTSGMKAAINGTPNISIGDGWWAEGFTGDNGWMVAGDGHGSDYGAQDWADAQALYTLIEEQIVPAFYDRDILGVPRRWIQIVKQSIRTVLPAFSARRMVKDYVRDMYLPALRRETLVP